MYILVTKINKVFVKCFDMFQMLTLFVMFLYSDLSCDTIFMWASMSPNFTDLQMAKTTFIYVRRH
jgi:hypothetical protein